MSLANLRMTALTGALNAMSFEAAPAGVASASVAVGDESRLGSHQKKRGLVARPATPAVLNEQEPKEAGDLP